MDLFFTDGLQDTNHIYRKNSDWESIMYGLNTILSKPRQQRMRMKWKYLVFPIMNTQVEDARKYALDLGFEEFEPKKVYVNIILNGLKTKKRSN